MEFIYFILIWSGIGFVGILISSLFVGGFDDTEYQGALVMGLLGGPLFLLWVIGHIYEDKKIRAQYAATRKEKEIKAKQKKEKALQEYPVILQKIEKDFNLIKADSSKLTKNFFDDTRKVLGYCTTLNKNEFTETKMLREILIFARLNVLQFYEANNIKNAESLSKKINTILRKIK
ncbi:MAG: hypothetical protein ACJ0FX_00485 [Gammaproteobacteria bacterium]